MCVLPTEASPSLQAGVGGGDLADGVTSSGVWRSPAQLDLQVEVSADCDRPPQLESWGSVFARPGRALRSSVQVPHPPCGRPGRHEGLSGYSCPENPRTCEPANLRTCEPTNPEHLPRRVAALAKPEIARLVIVIVIVIVIEDFPSHSQIPKNPVPPGLCASAGQKSGSGPPLGRLGGGSSFSGRCHSKRPMSPSSY